MAKIGISPIISNKADKTKKKITFSIKLPCALVIWSSSKLSPTPKVIFPSLEDLFWPVLTPKNRAKIDKAPA